MTNRKPMTLCVTFAAVLLCAPPTMAQNLLSNPAFDSDITAWEGAAEDLELEWVADAGSTLDGGSGPGALEVRHYFWNGGSSGPWQAVDSVEAGSSYELAGSLFRPGDADNVCDYIALSVWWYDTNGYFLSRETAAMYPLVDDAWTRVSSTVIAPAEATSARVRLLVGNPIMENETRPGVALFDDIWFASEGATTATQVLFYPAAAEAQGLQGTHWRTSARISSLIDFPVTVSGALLRQGQDNTDSVTSPMTIGTIPPDGFLAVDDLVSTLGGSGLTCGVYLLAEAQAAGLPADLVNATSYTWTPNAEGEGGFGQGLPAVCAGTDNEVTIPGIYQNASYRTNLGLLNTSAENLDIRVTVMNANGEVVSNETWTMQPYEHRQQGLPSLGVNHLEGGTAAFRRTSTAGSFHCYGSTVDQDSGDAIYTEGR